MTQQPQNIEPIHIKGVLTKGHLGRALGWIPALGCSGLLVWGTIFTANINPPSVTFLTLFLLLAPLVISLRGWLKLFSQIFGTYQLKEKALVRHFLCFKKRIPWADISSIKFNHRVIFNEY